MSESEIDLDVVSNIADGDLPHPNPESENEASANRTAIEAKYYREMCSKLEKRVKELEFAISGEPAEGEKEEVTTVPYITSRNIRTRFTLPKPQIASVPSSVPAQLGQVRRRGVEYKHAASRRVTEQKIRTMSIPKRLPPFSLDVFSQRIARGDYDERVFLTGLQGLSLFILKSCTFSTEKNYVIGEEEGVVPLCYYFDGEKWVEDKGYEKMNKVVDLVAPTVKKLYDHILSQMSSAEVRTRTTAREFAHNLRPFIAGVQSPNTPIRLKFVRQLLAELKPYLLL